MASSHTEDLPPGASGVDENSDLRTGFPHKASSAEATPPLWPPLFDNPIFDSTDFPRTSTANLGIHTPSPSDDPISLSDWSEHPYPRSSGAWSQDTEHPYPRSSGAWSQDTELTVPELYFKDLSYQPPLQPAPTKIRPNKAQSRNFPCPNCKKEFARRFALKRHMSLRICSRSDVRDKDTNVFVPDQPVRTADCQQPPLRKPSHIQHDSINKVAEIVSLVTRQLHQMTPKVFPEDRTRTSTMMPSSDGEHYHISFLVNWDPAEGFKAGDEDDFSFLENSFTLSGSAMYAYGATCSDYLETFWPQNSAALTSALQSAVAGGFGRASTTESLPSSGAEDMLELQVQMLGRGSGSPGQRRIYVTASGTESSLVRLALQLCWMGAALRTGTLGQAVVYSDVSIQVAETTQDPLFLVSYNMVPLHAADDVCWLPLFKDAVIARGFPIRERREEVGLEIPIDIMANIAGVQTAWEYKGGVVIKGYSSMFIPVARVDDRVQWHIVSSSDPTLRLSYQDGLEKCSERIQTSNFNIESLRTTRAIVGWCSISECSLGSRTGDYENIGWSSATEKPPRFRFQSATLGFSNWASASAQFGVGPKCVRYHLNTNGRFEDKMLAAEKLKIVLYEVEEHRAWLVPGSSVILHMAQHRHVINPFGIKGDKVALFEEDPLKYSARDILVMNQDKQLSSKGYTLEHLATDIWERLERIMDQAVERVKLPARELYNPLRNYLQGVEYRSIVEQQPVFGLQDHNIMTSSGGWTDLIEDINAVVLFGTGFGDIIHPSKQIPNGVCTRWQHLPRDKDYLASSVETMLDIYQQAGNRADCGLQLQQARMTRTEKELRWDRGNSALFECCNPQDGSACNCIRLQEICGKPRLSSVNGPTDLPSHPEGAVIFGSFSSFSEPEPSGWKPKRTFYSQSNLHINEQVSRTSPDSSQSDAKDSEGSLKPSVLGDVDTSCSKDYRVPQIVTKVVLLRLRRLRRHLQIQRRDPSPNTSEFEV